MKPSKPYCRPLLYCLTAFLIFSGCKCWGGGGRVSITVTDCPKAGISITAANYKTTDVGQGTYVLDADVSVKCNGNPVANAQIIVTIEGFAGASKTVQTDAGGNYHVNQRVQNAPPSGHNMSVTIKGSDGEKVETFSIP